jgi:hypothetical protein
MFKHLLKEVPKVSSYEELYDIPWNYIESLSLPYKKDSIKNINVGIFNVPCGGFGDIIACKTFADYMRAWFPHCNITVCTTNTDGYRSLGITDLSMNLLKPKRGVSLDDCPPLNDLKMNRKQNFDIHFIVPVTKDEFYIESVQQLLPNATYFNTFTVSEYNGILGKYTIPIGVGPKQYGLLLTDIRPSKQTILKKPYAMMYIAPPMSYLDERTQLWGTVGVHGNYCFMAFLEMIDKKYKYKQFQVIIPSWVADMLSCYVKDRKPGICYVLYQRLQSYIQNYDSIELIDVDEKSYILRESSQPKRKLILRGDILPKPRDEFISLINDSVNDVLLTGDQSITDAFSCCSNKRIWYQVAPWKKEFAIKMAKSIPDNNYITFKTSCGTLKGLQRKVDYTKFLKNNDFRKLAKNRIYSLMFFVYLTYYFKKYINIVNHSNTPNQVFDKLKKIV